MSENNTSINPQLGDVSNMDSPRSAIEQTTSTQPCLATKSSLDLLRKTSPRVLEDGRLRRSPDSEALISSDEEVEHQTLSYFSHLKTNSGISNLSSRRPSYAAEFQNRSRTYSVIGGTLSPATSNPTTPAGENIPWAGSMQGNGNSSQPFNLNWSIWNSDSRKSPPKPLSIQSTASIAPSASPLFAGSEALPSPTTVPSAGADFPIPIPTQPQLRNYRSMSFSVGQREIEDHTRVRLSPPTMLGKSGLQHRPSRPSLLSEEQFPPGSQPSPLRSVFEAEDDEQGDQLNDTQGSSNSYFHQGGNRLFNIRFDSSSRFRGRSASATTIPSVSLTSASTLGSSLLGGRENDRVMPLEEESAFIEDEDDFDLQQRSRINGRSMSMMHSSTDGQRHDLVRRQLWNSAASPFGTLSENGPQSRRHSFAAFAPTDVNNDYDLTIGRDLTSGLGARMGSPPRLPDPPNLSNGTGYNDRYYPGDDPRLRPRQALLGTPASMVGSSPGTPPNQQLHSLQTYSSTTRQPSPPVSAHRGLMGIPPHVTQQQRCHQSLYLVSFKACRADVFYVQEGTGLRVRKGDLVIVEADRGTDLGTVIHENITWQEAKQYKETYAKEHLTWLMMFATKRFAGAPGASANGSLSQNQFSGGLPQAQGQLGHEATPQVELKPKMIKRLAQVHEIQTLRDKEANEAKAKRVCQQKVLEHRLPMEILDAEFQMDWKKLTFYYFADSYINFNSLVTDLFKVYKTRIWMSALNPASFAHPTAGLPPPTMGESPNESGHQLLHPQLSAMPNYTHQSQPNASASILRQPYPSVGPPISGFTHRAALPPHPDFSHLPQQSHNGYAAPYMNGLGGSHQSPLASGGPASILGTGSLNMTGTGPDWMTLQGLTLHSH